eukprot:366051-Chlamydomonas_euryale.AAC.9
MLLRGQPPTPNLGRTQRTHPSRPPSLPLPQTCAPRALSGRCSKGSPSTRRPCASAGTRRAASSRSARTTAWRAGTRGKSSRSYRSATRSREGIGHGPARTRAASREEPSLSDLSLPPATYLVGRGRGPGPDLGSFQAVSRQFPGQTKLE